MPPLPPPLLLLFGEYISGIEPVRVRICRCVGRDEEGLCGGVQPDKWVGAVGEGEEVVVEEPAVRADSVEPIELMERGNLRKSRVGLSGGAERGKELARFKEAVSKDGWGDEEGRCTAADRVRKVGED